MKTFANSSTNILAGIESAREAVKACMGKYPNRLHLPESWSLAKCDEAVASLRKQSPGMFKDGLEIYRGWAKPVKVAP